MKSGLVTSAVLHAAALTWGLWSLSSPPPLDMTYAEALPIEIITSDAFEGVKGEEKAKLTDKPAPTPTTRPETLPMPAKNVGDNEADLETPPTPEKTRNQTPQTGAKKPAATPKAEPTPPVEEKVAETPPPEPPPPQPVKETPPPKPETPKEAVPTIDPLAEAIAAAETEPVPKVEPKADPVPQNVPVPQTKPKPPAPVKVAEAKPETPKATPPKKDRPVKPDVAKEDAPESDIDFEAMAAAAINKQKAAGGGAKRSTEQASLGSKKTTGLKLSQSEIGALQQIIKDRMRECWSVNAGAAQPGELRVSIQMRLNQSGELEGRPEIVEGGNGSFAARTAAEGARRAVIQCAPYNLPADKYEAWAEVTLNFDPAEMF